MIQLQNLFEDEKQAVLFVAWLKYKGECVNKKHENLCYDCIIKNMKESGIIKK